MWAGYEAAPYEADLDRLTLNSGCQLPPAQAADTFICWH